MRATIGPFFAFAVVSTLTLIFPAGCGSPEAVAAASSDTRVGAGVRAGAPEQLPAPVHAPMAAQSAAPKTPPPAVPKTSPPAVPKTATPGVQKTASLAATRPSPPAVTKPGFTEIARQSGLSFTHFIGATGKHYFPEIMGPGCALLDYDSDGDLDVLLVQGTILGPGKTWKNAIFPYDGPLPPRVRLFRNELITKSGPSGKVRFTDVTDASGIGHIGYGMGVATGDYDNDGDIDVYISNFGPDVLFRNNGDGTFTDVTAPAGLGDPRWNASATFFDYDNDGLLDLFVTAYNDFTIATHKVCYMNSGALEYCGPRAFSAIPARLYHNLGKGKFEDVTAKQGTDAAYGHGLGVVAGDFDGNGWQDLYVANDSDANLLWMNDHGHFTEEGLMRGAAYNEHGIAQAGMGIGIADYNDDGKPDLFVTNLSSETNTLWENRGEAMFEDVTVSRGLSLPSFRFTGFGAGWFDADNDGDLDLFIVNGDVRLVESEKGKPFPYAQTNQIMINEKGRYEDRSSVWGAALSLLEVSRGAAFGDVDNDGDVDVLVSNENGPVRLMRTDLPGQSTWILLRVLDKALRRDLLGASVRVTLSDGRVLTRWVHTDGSYLSASDPRIHFAWLPGIRMTSIEVVTPDRRVIPLKDVPLNAISIVTVGREGAEVRPGP